MIGVMVGTAAMVIVLSIFNGIDSLVIGLYSTFDPHLQITSNEGKQFNLSEENINQIQNDPELAHYCEVLDELALFHYEDRQVVGKIRGVTDTYLEMTSIDSVLYSGKAVLNDGSFDYAILGIGVSSSLGAASNFIRPLSVSVPKKGKTNILTNPFKQTKLFLSGVFAIGDPVLDDVYALVPLNVARELAEAEDLVTAIDLKYNSDVNLQNKQRELSKILGAKFVVKSQKELHADYFKVSRIERFFIFIIFSLILIIASFNLTGAITMLLLDKKKDINILSSFGMERSKIANIFFTEGFLITTIGASIGLVLGVLICYGQIYFGWLKFPGNFAVQAYPVVIKPINLVITMLTVMAIGSLLSYLPAKLLPKKYFEIHPE